MLSFPNCKINLGLSVINRRNDGYHNLETIFYPLAVRDILEIIPGSFQSDHVNAVEDVDQVQFSTSGLQIDGSNADNLCVKAYELLQKDFPELPPVSMHLHKAIPMGAGLGGGSADGAFVLKLLNLQFKLGLAAEQLINYAAMLGSDCPFFMINKPCFATGRGEIMDPVTIDLSGFQFILVNAGISINTGWAFSQLDLLNDSSASNITNFKEVVRGPVAAWKNELHNDFENPVFKRFPDIKFLKDELYNQGAVFASMTGSGSTVYGIFEKDAAPVFNFPGHYRQIRVPA